MAPRTRTTDTEILDAARVVFLEFGSDATTAAVAARAGISEALVFKRFHTKEALFERALAGVTPAWVAELEATDRPFPEQLERLALGMIESMRAEMPRTMLLWSRHPGKARFEGLNSAPVQGMKILSAWFEAQMIAGRMRRSDPEIFARVYSGAIVAYSMSHMTGLAEQMPIATTTFVRGLVDALWMGARPDGRAS
jgi:AcrR family transcriptional regulator